MINTQYTRFDHTICSIIDPRIEPFANYMAIFLGRLGPNWGCHKQGATTTTRPSATYIGNGSASSVMFELANRSAMLALPALPAPDSRATNNFIDPFAASLPIAPPVYVQQMSIRLLLDEQLLWQ